MHMSPCSVLTKKALDTGMHFSLGSRLHIVIEKPFTLFFVLSFVFASFFLLCFPNLNHGSPQNINKSKVEAS